MLDKKEMPAFTLAEVLITLGIIGVVAAITLPTLINQKNTKELEAGLKKNYAVASQALAALVDETGSFNMANYPNKTFASQYIKYFNIAQNCGNVRCVAYENHENEDGTIDSFYIKNYKTYSKKRNVSTHFFDDGQFILKDGSVYMIENAHIGHVYITIDVNGVDKNPNAWGHDLFTFQVMRDGRLLPMGAEGTAYTNHNIYCSPNSSDGLNGISCTYKAIYDKKYFTNLP